MRIDSKQIAKLEASLVNELSFSDLVNVLIARYMSTEQALYIDDEQSSNLFQILDSLDEGA